MGAIERSFDVFEGETASFPADLIAVNFGLSNAWEARCPLNAYLFLIGFLAGSTRPLTIAVSRAILNSAVLSLRLIPVTSSSTACHVLVPDIMVVGVASRSDVQVGVRLDSPVIFDLHEPARFDIGSGASKAD